jgi:catechol 2,3-dioxygenase-like lactoylglutathione lyase family enzyme
VDRRLEVVVVPVSNVDRARDFYLGLVWRLDADYSFNKGFRVVQLTPPGSACSIIFGTGVTSATPGSTQGLQLVVDDINRARVELAGRGAEVSGLHGAIAFHHADTTERVPGPAPEHKSYCSWVSFADPDGNSRFVQEVNARVVGGTTSALAVCGSVAGLADTLRCAAAAHGSHEAETGQPDPNWPDWYAQYMVNESIRWDAKS